jgi:membrane-associated protease RseP (regulator of RpoE activity)
MCGAVVMTSVGDLVDTRRFNPTAQNPTMHSGSCELPAPFYAPPAAYPVGQTSGLPYQTASLQKRWAKRHFVWLMVILLLSSVTLAGIGIGAKAIKSRRAWRDHRAEEVRGSRRSFNEDIQNALGFKPGNISDAGYADIKGVFIENLITDDGPVALANIQAGDVLTDLNGKPVSNPGEVARVLDSLKPGAEVTAKIYREGESISSQFKIADRSHPPLQPMPDLKDQGYIGVREATRRCCVPNGQKWGVEIKGTNDNSPADLAGLRAGDVITEYNGYPVRTAGEFNRRIRATKPRTKATVTFYRGNTKQTVEMILGYRT